MGNTYEKTEEQTYSILSAVQSMMAKESELLKDWKAIYVEDSERGMIIINTRNIHHSSEKNDISNQVKTDSIIDTINKFVAINKEQRKQIKAEMNLVTVVNSISSDSSLKIFYYGNGSSRADDTTNSDPELQKKENVLGPDEFYKRYNEVMTQKKVVTKKVSRHSNDDSEYGL